ncbi:MAG: universal stress protein [Desulfobacterales bacterium]|jgi:nucleotide-binding universal stress UspA family protein|nr:universal stress protein [Deltaproteobacteria bacterium]
MQFLVGYNGSVEAKAALSVARDFAKTFRAKVFVMSSMEGGAGEKVEDIAQAEQNLREAKTFLDEQGVECETHQMARGLTPGEDLVRFAEENQIDQIFVGIEKKSRTSKLILGSTAQFVILKAPCPVITTK